MFKLNTMTYTDQMFGLFSKDLKPTSPEAKELCKSTGHRQSGIHALFSQWKKFGKPDHYPKKVREAEEKEGLVTGSAGILPEPKGETEATETEQKPGEEAEQEQKEEEQQAVEGVKQEVEEKRESITPAFGEAENETFPGLKIAGETLPFKVHLSIKTLALYEILSREAGDGLSLGKFFDMVTEDYVLGRGVDLGLVELEKKQNGGQ